VHRRHAIVVLVLAFERAARAGGGAATDSYDDIRSNTPLDLHALTDLYAQYNFNQPYSSTSQLRAFDANDGLQLNFARLTIAHVPEPFGFRVDVGEGSTPNGYLDSDPAATAYPDLSRALSYIEQAFVSVRLHVAKRELDIDVGKFGTPVGLEDNESQQNWSYSRSLLYTWAEPTYHTGLRVTYALASALALSAFWVNGWNANILEGSGMRTFAVAGTWTPMKSLSVSFAYMGGLERAPTRLGDPTMAWRNELDAFATYALTKRLSLAVTTDYGHDEANDGVWWWGAGGYARYELAPWLAASVRAEELVDPDGFLTGTRQRVAEVTATMEVKEQFSRASVVTRLEYRRDQSDARVFETATAHATNQDTVTLGVMLFF
jgi:hypothetical protein